MIDLALLPVLSLLLLQAPGDGWAIAPGTATTSRLACDYTNEILEIMQNNSVKRATVNWIDFREQVIQRAKGAQTISDLYPAISVALGLLGDHHSYYLAASGAYVPNPTVMSCSPTSAAPPAIPVDIGYVRIPGFSSTLPGADVAFAESIQDQLRSRDRPGLAGWVVDVRGNTGGNMWPMIAGIGPVLGEGIAGYFVPPPAAPSTAWGYRNGGAFSGASVVIQTSMPYTLIKQTPKVAVLTDDAVASSGEAVVVAFRARPDTRSFGRATCGVSTANRRFDLSDRASLFLTVSVMADRTRALYGRSVVPDEAVSGDAEVVRRAIAWLRSGALLVTTPAGDEGADSAR
jgi:carboxyl-terminal processing protease